MKKIRLKRRSYCVHKIIHQIFRRSRATNSIVCGGILPKFKFIQAFMHFHVTCKSEADPHKMKALEWSQHFSHVYGEFSDAQGQLTPQSLVGSCRILNSSEILWLSSLPARLEKVQSKMKAQEWSQEKVNRQID